MSTITPEQQMAIAATVNGMDLATGIGDDHSACSVAAINLALSGELTDDIPDCMSAVIGRWIIKIQDEMPFDVRNSAIWKKLLPLAAGTGREHELERLELIMDWMWGTALPLLQPVADEDNFGSAWLQMTTERTDTAAMAAQSEAELRDVAMAMVVQDVRQTLRYAEHSAKHSARLGRAERWSQRAADEAAWTVGEVLRMKPRTDENEKAAWKRLDPCGLLARLIFLEKGEKTC